VIAFCTRSRSSRDSRSRVEGTTISSRSRNWYIGSSSPVGSANRVRSRSLVRLRAGRSGLATGMTSQEGSATIPTIVCMTQEAAMVYSVRDKVAIVTGGGSGIGESLCRKLARRGAQVAVADINAEDARRLIFMLRRPRCT
jgi:3-oxoacyl-ACP reductase-like protein